MKNFFYAVLVLVAIATSSCEKDDPQPEKGASAGTPVFAVNGTVNGAPIAINAGGDGYFMSTSFELDTNGVYNYIGELKPKVCTGICGNTLKIAIKDYELATAPTKNIDSTLVPGFYSFASANGTASQYSQSFVATPPSGGGLIKYTWDFGDNTILVTYISSVTHVYAHPGAYKVSLTTETSAGCVSTSIVEVQLGQTGNAFILQYIPSYNGDTVKFSPIPVGGVAPYTCVWDFGDGKVSNDYSPSHEYAAAGVYRTSLKMTDVLGVSSTQVSYVIIKNTSTCSTILVPTASSSIANPKNFGNAIVEWTDANGKVWSSNSKTQQPSASRFEIISVSDYLNSSNGSATKKIHVKFTCTLYSGFSSIVMKNIDATFSVGYK